MKASVRFEVSGLNQLRLLNTFVKEDIYIKRPDRKSQNLIYFSIDAKDKTRAIEIMEKLGFVYTIIDETNLKRLIKKAIPRLGLPIGIIVMIILSVYASSFLWKIEINGNARVDELTIVRTLRQNEISIGKKICFNADSVEEALLQLDGISAVSAYLVGTTLKIDVIESAEVSPPKMTGDIISLYDAEVTRIIVNSGTAKVKIGDRVPIGATLIEGVEYNTAGEPLMETDAQGEVFGKANFTYSETASLLGGYRRTGNKIKNTVIKFFGFEISKRSEEMPGYESETTITRIGNLFPLYAVTTTYYELEQLPDKTLEELEKEIKDKAINNLIICAGGSEIASTSNSLIISDKIYKITIHIEAEVSIGGKRID